MFLYNKNFFGGTEYMAEKVNSEILGDLEKFNNYNCLLAGGEEYLNNRDYIVWLHNNLYEFSGGHYFINKNISKIKKVICVSEWHKNKFLQEINFNKDDVVVINNAIDKINSNLDRFKKIDTIKIIHCSHPSRGMNILLHSIKNLNKDVEIHIFNDFYPDKVNNEEKKYLEELIENKKIFFYGITPRKTVHKYMSESHIFAYPAFFEETFCISQAEAMSAGCLSVTSNIGALKEISNGYSLMCDFDKNDFDKNVESYSNLLNEAIHIIENKEWNPKDQCSLISDKYSWEQIAKQWEKLHEMI